MSRKVITSKIPKLRFREFDGVWQENNLGELTTWVSGGTPPKDDELSWNGDIPWITASSMRGSRYTNSNTYITERGLNNGSKLAKKDSLLLLVRGSMLFNKIPVGIACRDLAFNQDVKAINPNMGLTSVFLLKWFYFNQNLLLSKVTGTGIGAGKLDLQELKKLCIRFPSLPEQQKIALFLSVVDEKIEKLKAKRSLLEQYKKGVMQKIFSREIRFRDENGKEFGGWEKFILSEIGDTYGGLSGKTKEDFGEGENYITYKQIFADSRIKIEKCEKVRINNGEKQNKAKYGDSFFTVSSETPDEIGLSSVLLDTTEGLYLNSFCFGFRPISLEVITPEFACFLFRSPFFRRDIVQLAQGSTRYNMSKIQFLKIVTFIPEKKNNKKLPHFYQKSTRKSMLFL